MSTAKYDSLLSPGLKLTEEQYETDRNLVAFENTVTSTLSRRGFLGSLMAAAAVAGTTMGTRSASAQAATPAITDVLNFALNLEYLEASLYLAATGGTLSAADMGSSPGTVSGAPVAATLALTGQTLALFQALAADETHHIEVLRSTITSLGGTPISMPNINLGAKGTIATAAQLLATARQFTAVGGSAYAGSAQYLVSNPAVLTAAAQILATEGQHDGAVNYQLVYQNFFQLSGAVDTLDVPPNAMNYFTLYPPSNAVTNTAMPPALAPIRTTAQVLGIVYGLSQSTTTTPATGTASGGFFPNGVNGNIKST